MALWKRLSGGPAFAVWRSAGFRLALYHPFARLILERVLHLNPRAWRGAFGAKLDRRFGLGALEVYRRNVDVHLGQIDAACYRIDHPLAHGLRGLVALLACAGCKQKQRGKGDSHDFIIPTGIKAPINPSMSNEDASASI